MLDLRPHWWFFVRSGMALAAALIIGLFILTRDFPSWLEPIANVSATGVMIFCLAWVGITYMRWVSTNFVLTTDRVITRRGMISKQGVEIPLDRINTVFFHQGILERLVGAGDLVIESASERGNERLTNIRRPSIVQMEIYVQMEENENRKFDRARVAPAGSAPDVTTPQAASIPEQIAQLSELHQRGVLSDAEFTRKKAELLDRM